VPAKRLTREQKRAATRDALLESAAKVFTSRGFEGASVEEIAEEAGYSRGAFYSNFESKEELFLTLIEGRTAERLLAIAEAFQQGDTLTQRLESGGQYIDSFVDRDRQWCVLYNEFWSTAVRDAKLRKRFAAQYELTRSVLADLIDQQSKELGVKLDATPQELATALVALFEGFVMQKLIAPGVFPNDFFSRLVIRFFARLGAFDTEADRPIRRTKTRAGTR
jgi:AcrR family transcriptional regulator